LQGRATDQATTIPAIGAPPLPHLERCAAAYREEYGGNEYGGLPVAANDGVLQTYCMLSVVTNGFHWN
jgi:hypothetical protein